MDRRTRDELAFGFSVVALLAFASSWMFLRTPASFTFDPLIGIAAALSCRRPTRAALVTIVGLPVGLGIAWLVPFRAWVSPETLPTEFAFAAIEAVVVAAGVSWVLGKMPRLSSVMRLAALAIIIATCWYAAITAAQTPTFADGSTPADVIASVPPLGVTATDEELYANVIDRIRRGEPYYSAYTQVFIDAGRADQLLASRFSYRLPTLYILLVKPLPPGGIPVVILMLTGATVAIGSAYALARRFVAAPLALVGCASVGSYYASISTLVGTFGPEIWGGTFGLLSVALLTRAFGDTERKRQLVWASAVVALVGLAFRELAVAFVLLGLAATLLDDDSRAKRLWLPWVLGLGLGAAGYAAHWAAATRALSATGIAAFVEPTPGLTWFRPDGLGMLAGLDRMARYLAIHIEVAWVIAVLAIVGAFIAPKDHPTRLVLGACTLAALVCLALFRPPGTAPTGYPPGYWADVVMPTILACVPLAFVWLPGARRGPRPVRRAAPDTLGV